MDRNNFGVDTTTQILVALLAEGVDRNSQEDAQKYVEDVALLAEGVDRNLKLVMLVAAMGVALLAEGVDRNFKSWVAKRSISASPSSRRAWIEIL